MIRVLDSLIDRLIGLLFPPAPVLRPIPIRVRPKGR
jgi:hypothetical protein